MSEKRIIAIIGGGAAGLMAAAYAAANEAATDAQEMADELVSLAEAAGHEIRR